MHYMDFNEMFGEKKNMCAMFAILNRSLKQQLTKQYLYSHLPLISQTVHVRRTNMLGIVKDVNTNS